AKKRKKKSRGTPGPRVTAAAPRPPALNPGTFSTGLREAAGTGSGLPFALSVPARFSRGLAWSLSPFRPASTQRGLATRATGLRNPLQKRKTQEESAENRCFCCHKSGACPPRHGVDASLSAPPVFPLAGGGVSAVLS